MFAIIARHSARLYNTSGSKCYSVKRSFSLISVHTTFPASLYRFQAERSSRLHKIQGNEGADALETAADGLVHPGIYGKLSRQYHLIHSFSLEF
jgi:hypothetical protein